MKKNQPDNRNQNLNAELPPDSGRFTPLKASAQSGFRGGALRWLVSPYLASIFAQRRRVLVLALCGAFFGSAVVIVLPSVYFAYATKDVMKDRSGVTICFGGPPPFTYILASQIDAMAVRVGLPNPKLVYVFGW